jgi:hypothetical protein
MGAVYKAHDPHLDRIVAVKLPHLDGPTQDRSRRVQRFHREARLAARVWHPQLCPIYDIGEHDGQPFVVMAFIEGQSLAQRITTKGRFDDAGEAVRLARQVLAALAAVHRQGIIHRDLKDSNILLDGEGRAVLADFGLARPENDAERLTSDGVILGTPSFMSPEIAAGRADQVGPWTDLYGVGVVLYRMLTGRLPFEGPPLTVLAKVTHENPAPPSQWRADLDPALEAIVLKALEREPGRRFQNAAEFADALERWHAVAVDSAARVRLSAGHFRPASPGEAATVAANPELSHPPRRRPRIWFRSVGWLVGAVGWVALAGVLLTLLLNWGCSGPMTTKPIPIAFKTAPAQKRTGDAEELVREAARGHIANVKRILSTGINPNAKSSQGQTALMMAAAGGHIEVVSVLLELLTAQGSIPYGAPERLEVNEADSRGETALMKAAENGHADVVQAMLDLKLDSNAPFKDKLAAGKASDARPVAVNLKDDQGETALMKARKKNHVNVVEILRKAGAKDPDAAGKGANH